MLLGLKYLMLAVSVFQSWNPDEAGLYIVEELLGALDAAVARFEHPSDCVSRFATDTPQVLEIDKEWE